MAQPTPTFLDYFALHFATSLLGPKQVVQRFVEDPKKRKRGNDKLSKPTSQSHLPLYWRSPILVDDPASRLGMVDSMPGSGSQVEKISQAQNDDSTLLFVDVTFVFAWTNIAEGAATEAPPTIPQLLVTFGFFFLLPNQPARYVKSNPLTQSTLEAHATALGFDTESTPSNALAHSMARELLALSHKSPSETLSPQCSCLNSISDPDGSQHTIDLVLRYRDAKKTATLSLDVAASTSSFDSLGTSLFVCQMQSSEPTDKSTQRAETIGVGDLEAKYLYWFQKQHRLAVLKSASTSEARTLLMSSPRSISMSQSPSQPTKRPNTASTGLYAPVGTKRKKKGKLVFADSP